MKIASPIQDDNKFFQAMFLFTGGDTSVYQNQTFTLVLLVC